MAFRVALPTLLLTSYLLVGCASYSPLEISPEKAAADYQSRSLTDAGLKRFIAANHLAGAAQAPSEACDFETLTLVAFYYSPDLDAARADWMAAQAGVKSAKERPNPTFGFSPGYNQTAKGITPWILGYTLDIPIETFGKRGHRIAEAQHEAESVRLNVASAAWTVRSQVRRALIELQAAEEATRLWDAQAPLLADAARVVKVQAATGAVAPLETTQANIALDQAILAERDAHQQATHALSDLAHVCGLPLSALKDIAFSFQGLDQPPTAPSLADAHRQAATNRADLLAALADFAAKDEAFRLEIARQYPDIHLAPAYTLDQGEGKWTPFLTFNLPVLNQNRAPIAAAKAERAAAAARFNVVQAGIMAEVDQATVDYTTAVANLSTLESLRSNVEKQVRTVRAMQGAGELSKLELTTALLDANRNTLSLLEARTHTEIALAALEDAIQSPVNLPQKLWSTSPRSSVSLNKSSHE